MPSEPIAGEFRSPAPPQQDSENIPTTGDEPLSPEEAAQIVHDGIIAFRSGLSADEESTRQNTFDLFMPTKAHLVILFGEEDGAAIWALLEHRLAEMRQNTHRFKAEFQRFGSLVSVAVFDLRASDMPGPYEKALKAIPESIPVYRAHIRYAKGASGSRYYVIINGQMVFVRGLEGMHKHLPAQ